MLINYPLIGSASKASWLTCKPNIFSTVGDIFKFPAPVFSYIGSASAPSDGSPWWFAMDFQEALSLKTFNYFNYGSSEGVPSPLNIYGSATGAFGGEETLIQTFTNMVPISGSSDIPTPYVIDTPQSFQHYKFEIISFADTFGVKYSFFYGLSFEFIDGDLTFDTVTDYIEPNNKMVGDDDWTFLRRLMYGDSESRLRTLLCMFVEDFGWEVELIKYPDYIVVKSRGVDDAQPYVYYYVQLTSTRIIFEKCYGYWDSEAKTGTLEMYYNKPDQEGCTFSNSESGMGLCAWGDKDWIMFSSYEERTSSYKKGGTLIGRIPYDSNFRPAHTTFVNAVSAGAALSIEVVSSAGFEVGNYYCVWGAGGEGRDWGVRCTEVTDATHIVVDNIPRDYSAGSFIGNHPQTAFYFTDIGFSNFGQRHKSGLITEYGTYQISSIAESLINPSGPIGKYVIMPSIWREYNGTDPGIMAMDKHMAGEIAGQAPFDVHLVGAGQPGTATDGGTKTLEDTTKTWTVNEHAGKFVYISAGTGYHGCGNFVEIVSNTADTLTVAYDWITDPVAGDTYYIADEVWQVPIELVTYAENGAMKCGG